MKTWKSELSLTSRARKKSAIFAGNKAWELLLACSRGRKRLARVLVVTVLASGIGSCRRQDQRAVLAESGVNESLESGWAKLAHEMVATQIERREVRNGPLLAAMRKIPRHRFVPPSRRKEAYSDGPLPIGYRQTISQPFVVARMTEALELEPRARVLEIGTGSGYQAAVLAELAKEVYTIEIVAPLAERARQVLAEEGYRNIQIRTGDGFFGWPEAAPFDAIIVTAAPPEVPQPLLDQLAPGGILVVPVGQGTQQLIQVRKTKEGLVRRKLLDVRFVPMTGEAAGD